MNKDQLKKAGLKITNPRVKILQSFSTAKQHHLSAEDIYKELLEAGEDIGLATVYRVLTQFETAGIVNRLNFERGSWVFELNQGEHHDHLICQKCGKVQEFVDEVIEERQHLIAEQANFSMTHHSLNIYGLCRGCAC